MAGIELDDQAAIDAALLAVDGTPNKGRLGANALLGVSLAAAHAAAAVRGEELFVHLNRLWKQRAEAEQGGSIAVEPTLPLPMVNMISGGLHAGRNLDIQDVLIIPVGAESYSHALEMIVAMYRAVGGVLAEIGAESVLVGDEGGYGPKLRNNEQAFEVVVDAMVACGFEPGRDVAIAVDVASTHFFHAPTKTYRISEASHRSFDGADMVDLLARWVDRYPIVSIEDGLAEDDWEGWQMLTERLGKSVQLIGDDLFVTQTARLERGIASRAANAILIKVNQVGTLSETLDALLVGASERLPPGRLGAIGRDRGRDDRRPRRGNRRRPDQDRLRRPIRTPRQVQPPPPHRGSPRPRRPVRGPRTALAG